VNAADSRVASYLDDLARMLCDLDPTERDEVLAGIREHLDATLAEHPDDAAAVNAALLRLGPPEQVAAEARAGRPSAAIPAGATAPPAPHPAARERRRTRTRIATAVALAPVVAMALWTLTARVATLTLVYGGWGNDSVEALLPHPSEIVLLVPLSPLWLVPVVLVLVDPEVSARPKVWLTVSGPAVGVLALVATFWLDPMAVSTTVVMVGIAAVLGLVVAIARRVWRETRA